MKIDYDIPLLRPYINWGYFYHAWQVRPADEQQRLRREAEQFLSQQASRYQAHALFSIEQAHADGDDIVLDDRNGERIALLRQQTGSPCLCLSDFINPAGDRLGLFATSVDQGMETDFDHDPYQKMMAQLLADRLAEAAAELMHLEVRRFYWGYAPDEQLSIDELHQERFQGIRPAVGYPSLPDASLNFQLDRLLGFGRIGITLTESGAMRPHASVSGLMIAHPQARYFSVGKIGSDQLNDYARRRNQKPEVIRKFLSANL
ncbi:MAG: 5-methyltetrahydrofolate--homocysteine methyltransferase [Prevotella sp.]|nr:5-methyltetrahydrofolate--homocysteine methyltransferase [Prevotella sp.]